MSAIDTHELARFMHSPGENLDEPTQHTKAEVQAWLGGQAAHIADHGGTTMDAITDNTTGAVSTTLASISDAATKNAVASLNAQLAKAKTDIGTLSSKLNAVLARLEAAGISLTA
jgi:hypothetical protein